MHELRMKFVMDLIYDAFLFMLKHKFINNYYMYNTLIKHYLIHI